MPPKNNWTNPAMIGASLIISHLIVLFVLGVLTAIEKFFSGEMFIVVGLISPLFITYTVPMLRWLLAEEAVVGNQVRPIAILLSWIIAACYVSAIIGALFWKAYGSLGMENLLKLIGAIETSFAAYMGLIAHQLFPNTDKGREDGTE